jgi:hypothetical protein
MCTPNAPTTCGSTSLSPPPNIRAPIFVQCISHCASCHSSPAFSFASGFTAPSGRLAAHLKTLHGDCDDIDVDNLSPPGNNAPTTTSATTSCGYQLKSGSTIDMGQRRCQVLHDGDRICIRSPTIERGVAPQRQRQSQPQFHARQRQKYTTSTTTSAREVCCSPRLHGSTTLSRPCSTTTTGPIVSAGTRGHATCAHNACCSMKLQRPCAPSGD